VAFAAFVMSAWGVLLGLVVPLLVRWFVGYRLRRVRTEFAEQLPDNLDVVSSALRAGHSLVGALAVTVEAGSEPSRSELGRALADEQLGVPLDDALRVVAKRMANRDLIQVAMVAMLQREAGTNAAEVLERVSENVRNQMDLKRLVRTLTAQGRMARWIVSLLPLFLFTALFLLNQHYLSPLWRTNGGIAAMCVAGLMVATGSLVIKRIVEIDV
jgi:tight adherence protein B